jgi:hypothetical protein
MRRPVALCVAACTLAACGGQPASPAAQRAVAARFAHALVEGRVARARTMLAHGVDPVVPELVRRLAAPARMHPGVIRSRGSEEERNQWSFAYFRQVTSPDGSFTRETGQVVVDLTGGSSPTVRFFGLRDRQIVYSTHHDSVLLPSKR